MRRFFVDDGIIQGNEIEIKGGDVKHIRDVLRLKPNDRITVLDGSSAEYEVSLNKINGSRVTGAIISRKEFKNVPVINLILAQGIPKKDKMETIIRMTTELGVKEIIPMVTERVVVKGDFTKKINRWQKIALESCKQCKRSSVPLIRQVAEFKDVAKLAREYDLALIPWEVFKGEKLKQILKNKKAGNIIIFIGPEGGFSYEEVRYAKENGVIPVSLGSRILRVETAGVVGISIIMNEYDEI